MYFFGVINIEFTLIILYPVKQNAKKAAVSEEKFYISQNVSCPSGIRA